MTQTGVTMGYAKQFRNRYGDGDLGPPELLASRLRVRQWTQNASLAVFSAVLIVYVLLRVPGRSEPDDVIWMALLTAGLALPAWLALVVQRLAERRIARGLDQRVARETAVSVSAVLGRWSVACWLATYPLGVVLGVLAAVFAPTAADRSLGVVLLIAVLALGALSVAVGVDVTRRPAIAVDAGSLRADDLFRTEDLRMAAFPYPLLIASVAAVNSANLMPLLAWSALLLLLTGAAAISWRTRGTVPQR
ncbi:hypothetical protein BC739_007713 [Kutzneria viridogrisea]|uniref:ABC-2 type transport system permease protein n=1 Tax=Kutzneria viridogrisea TaxID=47990 RepID=A0ABR6BUX2_9PSEU|nr:hypothetical protein [Kutzneria viridogrisea]